MSEEKTATILPNRTYGLESLMNRTITQTLLLIIWVVYLCSYLGINQGDQFRYWLMLLLSIFGIYASILGLKGKSWAMRGGVIAGLIVFMVHILIWVQDCLYMLKADRTVFEALSAVVRIRVQLLESNIIRKDYWAAFQQLAWELMPIALIFLLLSLLIRRRETRGT